jgi:hypothetical protein
MTNVESIWLADSPEKAPHQKGHANGDQAQLTPAEPRLADSPSHSIALDAGDARLTATLPHWEHFLKGRFESDTQIRA